MSTDSRDFDPLVYERDTLKNAITGMMAGPYLVSLLIGIISQSSLIMAFIPAIFAAGLVLLIALGKNTKTPRLLAGLMVFCLWNVVVCFWAMLATVPMNFIHILSSGATVAAMTLLCRFWIGHTFDTAIRAMNERIRKARENGTYRDPFEDMFGGGFAHRGTYRPTGGAHPQQGQQQRNGFGGYDPNNPNDPRNAWKKPFEEDMRRAGRVQVDSQLSTAYQTLGVPSHADQATVKAAYRKLVAQWHPDKAGNAGTQKMAQINAAKDLVYKANSWK